MADRFLLAPGRLAVMRINHDGPLTKGEQDWAEKFGAILVVPEGAADKATRKQLDRYEAKHALIRDVVEQFTGDGREEHWNYQAMVQAIKIIKGMVKE